MNSPARPAGDRKTIIVTGAGSGIGRATAHRFLDLGATVVLVGRTPSALADTAAGYDNTLALPADVSDAEACRNVVGIVNERFGRLDVLFNNAGVIYRDRTAPATTDEEWRTTMAVNVDGTFWMSRAAVEVMEAQGSGVIINNASYFGLVGGRGAAAYCASKAAVVGLTRAMALDHARSGIRINCICPGSVDTPMLAAEIDALGGSSARRSFEQKHPVGRIAEPTEIADLVAFLASEDAAYMNGAAVPIDGGITAR